jgi:hypothetical protein
MKVWPISSSTSSIEAILPATMSTKMSNIYPTYPLEILFMSSIRLWRTLHSNTLKVAACQFQPNKSKYDKNEYSHNLVVVSHKVSDQNYVLSFLSDFGNERKSQS